MTACFLNHWHTTDCFCIFSPLYISLIYVTNTLMTNIRNIYKYTILNMLIIIIGLLVYNNYSFLLYSRFHSSPVEHENLKSKVVLMGKSTKFFRIYFLKCAINKILNKSCFHHPNSRFVVKIKINNNKWKIYIAKTI